MSSYTYESKRNLMNELTEGIEALAEKRKDEPAWKSWNWPTYTPFTPTNIVDRAKKESEEIEQILGKELSYPRFKDDSKNFPNATESDGVCVKLICQI